jgi:hypothetical protein
MHPPAFALHTGIPMRLRSAVCLLVVAFGLEGCSKKPESNVPTLHPVKGVVNRGGKPVNGGELFIRPDQEHPNLLVSATVGTDGRFDVASMDTQDRDGKRLPGAPEGTYRITYTIASQDQTAPSVVLSKSFVVEAKANEWLIELEEKK